MAICYSVAMSSRAAVCPTSVVESKKYSGGVVVVWTALLTEA